MTLSSATPQRNGFHTPAPPDPPRRIGSVPYRSPSGGLYQIEQWGRGLPARPPVWYVCRGGLYATRTGFEADAVTDAFPFPTAAAAKRQVIRFEVGQPPELVRPASLLYRGCGRMFHLDETAPGGPWRVGLGASGGYYLGPREGFLSQYPDAASAQAAVEAYLSQSRRPLVAARLRELADRVEAGEIEATIGPADPRDGSCSILVRPARPAAGGAA